MTITYIGVLTPLTCGECFIPFAIPGERLKDLQRTGVPFWCPNGHKISYADDENTRLRAQLDQANAEAKWQRQRRESAQREADHQAARARGYKGALTKTKKRVGNGVCPCCNRSFVNLARHMAGQHPDYADAEP